MKDHRPEIAAMKTADELLAAIDEKACLDIVADWVRH